MQESLLRLWRKPDLLRQCGDGFRAWLFTVARNQVIDDRRSARYARELQTDTVPERSSSDEIGPAFDKWILSRVAGPANRVAGEGCRPMTDDIAVWDAFVLGALSREDRHTYEAYLVSNPERAAALTELAGLPGILNMLSCDEAVALTEHAGDAPAEVPGVDLPRPGPRAEAVTLQAMQPAFDPAAVGRAFSEHRFDEALGHLARNSGGRSLAMPSRSIRNPRARSRPRGAGLEDFLAEF